MFVVYAAVITASFALIGITVNLIYGETVKRRTKIWESRLMRCDEQIGKLYAPLINLVEQLDTTDDIKNSMVRQDPEHQEQISKLLYDRHFQEIHKKIAIILENQMHLLEGREIPESFNTYYAHVASEKVVFSLVEDLRCAKANGTLSASAADIKASPVPYPEPQFKLDILQGFDRVLARQERLLNLIKMSDSYGRRISRTKRILRLLLN